MSDIVQIVTIITPKPGKIEEGIQNMTPYSAWVEANEPDCLRYEIFRQMNGDAEVLVVMEIFKNQDAREAHRVAPEHLALLKKAAEDGILACPPDIKELKHVSGFNRSG